MRNIFSFSFFFVENYTINGYSQQKAPSKESDEHQGTSGKEADPPKEVNATQIEPEIGGSKPPTDPEPVSQHEIPMETANQEEVEESPLPFVVTNTEGDSAEKNNPSETESESAKQAEEGDKDEGVVSLGSSSEDTAKKEGASFEKTGAAFSKEAKDKYLKHADSISPPST